MSVLFPGADASKRSSYFERLGRPYGLTFCPNERISNSGPALEAEEFARDHDKFEEFHELIFKTYFTDCKDIGKVEIVVEVADSVGLNTGKLKEALTRGIYKEKLKESRRLAQKYEITAAPTFIIGGKHKIVGLQKREVFEEALKTASNNFLDKPTPNS